MTTVETPIVLSNDEENPLALSVSHVAKSFRLPTEQASGLKQAFLNWTKGIKGYREQQVLRDISFEVRKGDFFGIVGRNGSGKSTSSRLFQVSIHPKRQRCDKWNFSPVYRIRCRF